MSEEKKKPMPIIKAWCVMDLRTEVTKVYDYVVFKKEDGGAMFVKMEDANWRKDEPTPTLVRRLIDKDGMSAKEVEDIATEYVSLMEQYCCLVKELKLD